MDLSSLTSADTLSYSFTIYATALRYHDEGKTAHSLHVDEDSFADITTRKIMERHVCWKSISLRR